MTEKTNTNQFRQVWIALLTWISSILVLHIICRALHIPITSGSMLVNNLLALFVLLLINAFYLKVNFFFEWFGFKRIGWLLIFAIIYIIAINALFMTVPSHTSLEISLDPFYWLFFILASATIPIISFFGVFLPAIMRSWKNPNYRVLKSLLLSSLIFSIFETVTLNNVYGGLIATIYQLIAQFALGLICGLFYLRSVNVIVPTFFGFLETFCAVILTQLKPLLGNGIFNIVFFVVFILILLKVTLRPQNINQIEKDFKLSKE